MIREVEYRGKAVSSDEWVYGNFIHSKRFAGCPNEFRIHNQETGLESNVLPETVGQFTGLYDATAYSDATIEQRQYAIRLAEKNKTTPEKEWRGVKIFEGDIIACEKKSSLYKNLDVTVIGVICFENIGFKVLTIKTINKQFNKQGSCYFGVTLQEWIHAPDIAKSKIIGNIHDNPELLEGK